MNEEGNKRLLPSNINPKDRECDFYRNPTILSRLIQNFKYRAAIQRLETHGPAEAAVWVCSRRADEDGIKKSSTITTTTATTAAKSLSSSIRSHARQAYGYRMLPIHMAVESLYRVADGCLRSDLESLISHLVVVHPRGCARRDHRGRLPLHEAISHDASPETISALLMAYPAAGRERDAGGRYPIEVNEHRGGRHKGAVNNLLRRKDEFWVAAGQEAHYRLKHRRVPRADQSVTSTSVLAGSVKEDDDTLASTDSFEYAADPCHPKAADEYTGRVKAMRWEQIEKRAMTLESKLAESYEQNFRLKKEVTELKVAKALLQKKIEKLLVDDPGQQIAELVTDKEDLQRQIRDLRSRLVQHGLSDHVNEAHCGQHHPEVLEFPNDQEQSRQAQIDKLTRELKANQTEFSKYQNDMQTKIMVLEKELERVRIRKDEQIMELEANVEELKAKVDAFRADKTVSDFSRSDETISTTGSAGPPTPSSCADEENNTGEAVDDVLRTAVSMNGGLGLSPRMVEMWNKVNGHAPTLRRISENTRYDPSEVRGEKEEREKFQNKDDDDDVNFGILYRQAANKYHARDSVSSTQNAGGDTHLFVPTLEDRDNEEVRIPPPSATFSSSRGISQDLSDVMMSTPSTTMMIWNASGYGQNFADDTTTTNTTCGRSIRRCKGRGPRNMTKEISEMTMSMLDSGAAPVPAPHGRHPHHRREGFE